MYVRAVHSLVLSHCNNVHVMYANEIIQICTVPSFHISALESSIYKHSSKMCVISTTN